MVTALPSDATQLHMGVAPVWELPPRGHAEVGPLASVSHRDAQLRRGLAMVDVVAAFVAVRLLVALVDPGTVRLHVGSLLLVPLVLLTGKLVGLYDRDQHVLRKTTIDEAPAILYLSVVYALGAWLCEAVLFHGELVRGQVFGLLLLMFTLTALGRIVARRLAMTLTTPERCIVLGTTVDAARIAAKLAASASVNATVIGRVALDGTAANGETGSIPTLGGYDALGAVVSHHEVERVIIAPHDDGQDQVLDAIRLVMALGVSVSVLPRLLEVVGSSSTFDDIEGMCLLGVRQYGLARSSELIKRATDVLLATGLLIVLSPLLLILTVVIKADTPGPVLFRQRRIGRRGERFSMLKFRSMVVDAEARKAEVMALNEVRGGMFKITEDPRITRSGRFLRRTSLDELPQLFNVVRGDMSLVGPRPLIPDEDMLITGWQRRRLAVKPGMTGLWQIFGSSRIPLNEMVKIDYLYGANWSLWLDLRILLRTLPYMLSRRGL
jgi:exopolysaccharide biosynthesis polyprenyl glycosylphosphotransferase